MGHRPWPRCVALGGVQEHQVQVRAIAQLDAAELAEAAERDAARQLVREHFATEVVAFGGALATAAILLLVMSDERFNEKFGQR